MKKLLSILTLFISLFFSVETISAFDVDSSNAEIVKAQLAKLIIVLSNADEKGYEALVPRASIPFNYDFMRENLFDQFAHINLENYYLVHFKTQETYICIQGDINCINREPRELGQQIVLVSNKQGEPGIKIYNFNRNYLFTNIIPDDHIYLGNALKYQGFGKNILVSNQKLTDFF